jgi:hypothetical protein
VLVPVAVLAVELVTICFLVFDGVWLSGIGKHLPDVTHGHQLSVLFGYGIAGKLTVLYNDDPDVGYVDGLRPNGSLTLHMIHSTSTQSRPWHGS